MYLKERGWVGIEWLRVVSDCWVLGDETLDSTICRKFGQAEEPTASQEDPVSCSLWVTWQRNVLLHNSYEI